MQLGLSAEPALVHQIQKAHHHQEEDALPAVSLCRPLLTKPSTAFAAKDAYVSSQKRVPKGAFEAER